MRIHLYLPILVFTLTAVAFADQPVLERGDRLAIIGDSITEQKLYSKFIETYLLACYPDLDIQSFQFGWGGERATGFAARMENDLVPWSPDVVTTCYGMNDGSYRAYEDQIGKTYEEAMRQILERMRQANTTVVVGSPGVVDSSTWRRDDPDFDQVYNDNLEHLAKIAQHLPEENQLPYGDVFGAMKHAMTAAKAELGETYPVAGNDGVHPGPNGQLVMAYAFLKALGLDGDIGTIVVDISSNHAEASAGHRIVQREGHTLEMESSRYPFCFSGDAKSPDGTSSILPNVPFNNELNRFTLKVTNLNMPNADVTFGPTTKTFSKQQLSDGINLAAEFLDNPFVEPFNRVLNEVGKKQAFETSMIKGFITNIRQVQGELADNKELKQALVTLRKEMSEVDDEAYAKAKAAVTPVRYQITIQPKS